MQIIGTPEFWQGIEASAVGSFIASSEWAFPTIETVHVIALVTVVGTIAIMDLRLLGLASRDYAVTATSKDTLPYTWGAFVLAAITGTLLFVSKAHVYAISTWFQLKMVMLVLAGLNMAIFHVSIWRTVEHWDTGMEVPRAGKIAAGLSLFFWLLVVFFGRVIGFTLGLYE